MSESTDAALAAGHLTSLELLLLLASADHPMRTSEVATALSVSPGAVRHHAGKLFHANLILVSPAETKRPGRPENQMALTQRGRDAAAKLGETASIPPLVVGFHEREEVGIALVVRVAADAVSAFENGDATDLVAELLGQLNAPSHEFRTLRLSLDRRGTAPTLPQEPPRRRRSRSADDRPRT
jgi:predicted ArsR family transcriptional regulator